MRRTQLRLWAAAVLCLLPLGFAWPGGSTSRSPGLASQAPIRVFLVAAGVGFLICATCARTATTRRIARLACLSAGVATLLATGSGAAQILLCLSGALVLVVPLVSPVRVGSGSGRFDRTGLDKRQ